MLIAARNAFTTGGGAPTARDYVQDGLIAMWDGIENAGWGTHDPNATTWEDLTGNGYDLAVNTATFNGDDVSISSGSLRMSGNIEYANILTAEIGVAQVTSGYCIAFFNSRTRLSYNHTNKTGVQFDERKANNTIHAIASTYCAIYNDGRAIAGYADGHVRELEKFTDWTKGENNVFSPSYGIYSFVGRIRFIRLYSRALTAAEIAANYAVDKARFNLP